MSDEPAQQKPLSQSTRSSQPRRLWPAFRVLLRNRIVAGLLMVIPIWVTWVVVKFVFDTMKSATEPIAWAVADRIQAGPEQTVIPERLWEVRAEVVRQVVTDLVQRSQTGQIDSTKEALIIDEIVRKFTYVLDQVPDAPVGLISETYLAWIVPVSSVLLTLFLLYVLGLLTASMFGRRLIFMVELLFGKLPLVKTIYHSTKQIVMTLGGSQLMNFQRVVLIEFPRPGMKCIGFLTSVIEDVDTGRKMATIFISTTPNPTTGYMQIVPLEEVSETGWSVEQAVKLMMSGGLLSPPKVPFDKIHPVQLEPGSTPGRAAAVWADNEEPGDEEEAT